MVVVKSVRKTVVIMVIRFGQYILAREMKRGMTFEYLMCRADLNFEVDFGVNGAIGRGDWGDFGHGRLRTLHPAACRSIKSCINYHMHVYKHQIRCIQTFENAG